MFCCYFLTFVWFKSALALLFFISYSFEPVLMLFSYICVVQSYPNAILFHFFSFEPVLTLFFLTFLWFKSPKMQFSFISYWFETVLKLFLYICAVQSCRSAILFQFLLDSTHSNTIFLHICGSNLP